MVAQEPGSTTLYADNSRPRPLRRSISGPSSHSTAPFPLDHHHFSMSGYDSTNSNRSQASKGGVPGADQDNRRDSRHDSHDLSISNRGRDSLLDNLLLSFEKISDGTFGNFDTSPFFSNIDEVDDDESLYSRRGRADSIGYHSQYSTSAPRKLESSHGEGSFGVTYDSSRDTRSRGRGGLNSSHGYVNGYEPAPAPSIRTRNRTPSPPKSPRLVRRPSNKSVKSLRSRDQQFIHHPPTESTLPPLPAFASLPLQVVSMAPSKSNGRPGFFRRVFGGGSSSSSSSANNTTNTNNGKSSNNTTGSVTVNPPTPHATDSPQSVITKKSSFFRRRKKSVSDVGIPPVPAAPVVAPINVPAGPPTPVVDPVAASPSTSLRTAMNPYIRPPPRPATLESTVEVRETAYLARNATIRTVASSDPITPRHPSFFSESPRGRESTGKLDGSGKKYQKETWAGTWETGGTIEEQGPRKSPKDTKYRPQTSPYSPLGSRTFFLDEDEGDMHWPPSPPFRGILSGSKTSDNRFLESERHESVDSLGKARKSSVASKENAIIDIREIEKLYSEEKAKQKAFTPADKSTPQLGIVTTNLKPPKPKEGSWITSPSTPTVTLQKDGPDEEAEILGSDSETETRLDDGLSEPTREDKKMARKIFESDEEFVSKDRAAAWLGDT
jgi:hypothetical protein